MVLAELEGEKHLATVRMDGRQFAFAEFRLDGHETYLQLYSDQPLIGWTPPSALLAYLPDGTCLTFLECIVTSAGTYTREEGRSHVARLQPHWVAVGRRHLTEEVRLHALDVLVDDAPSIFYDFDAFGHSLSPEDHIDAILQAKSQAVNRTIQRGGRPIIAYYTGRWTICEAESAIGRVSAHHSITRTMGGPSGINISNRIFTQVQPLSPATLDLTVDAFFGVLRFLEMMAGRPQNILSVIATLARDDEPRERLDIYWPLRPHRDGDLDRPHPADIPVNGGMEPQTFARVMAAWLAREETRREARVRYSSVTRHQNNFGVDRLVGAANMFDVLPPDAVTAANDLPLDISEARDAARALFADLAVSAERDSVLSALGRLGQPSLKRKVQHRAAFLTTVAEARFPELILVVDEAVNCRNRYVHGSATRIDYAAEGAELVPFLTTTLEFVFGASELIEAGWDLPGWLAKGTTMSHPWGSYRVSYAENLARLKQLLSDDPSG